MYLIGQLLQRTLRLPSRVAVLRNGKLQQLASPTELYDRPANAFVAGFMGTPTMNLLTAATNSDGLQLAGQVLPGLRDQRTTLATQHQRTGRCGAVFPEVGAPLRDGDPRIVEHPSRVVLDDQ
jgi:ABC-type sugar transport system ATPase subunit